jgi:hypothetical protein
MRKFGLIFTLLVALIFVLTAVVIAQDDDTPDPNLCADGTWHCPDPDDPAREEWNYTCGWYLGMYNAGEISSFPGWCVYSDSDGDGVEDDVDVCPMPGDDSINSNNHQVGDYCLLSPTMCGSVDYITDTDGDGCAEEYGGSVVDMSFCHSGLPSCIP